MSCNIKRLFVYTLLVSLLLVTVACKKTDRTTGENVTEGATLDMVVDHNNEVTLELNENVILQESFQIGDDDVVDEYYQDKVVSYISPYVPIYSDMAANHKDEDKMGLMLPKSEATIVEIYAEYTKISFGDSEGYIRNESVLFGKEAEIMAKKYGTKSIAPKTEELAVRKVAYEGASVLTTVNKQSNLQYVSTYKEWLLVNTDAGHGYVLADEVDITYTLKSAMTTAEYKAFLDAEAARRAAELERQRKIMRETAVKDAIAKYSNGVSLGKYSYDEIWLLACIVKYESGWEPYEGKLAVANVVLNRVKDSRFPSTIKNVVYSRNQFTGVSNGYGGPSSYFANNYYNVPITNGPHNYGQKVHPQECMRAAIEALCGINNIGDRLYFMSSQSAAKNNLPSYGKDIHVIGNHWFYNR